MSTETPGHDETLELPVKNLCQLFNAAPSRHISAQPRKAHFEDDDIVAANVNDVSAQRSTDREDLPVVATVANVIPTGSQLPRTPHIKVNKEDMSLSSTSSSPNSAAVSAQNSPKFSSEVQSKEKSDIPVATNIDENQAKSVHESENDPILTAGVGKEETSLTSMVKTPPAIDIIPEDQISNLVEQSTTEKPAAITETKTKLTEESIDGSGQVLTEEQAIAESGEIDKSFGSVSQHNLSETRSRIKSTKFKGLVSDQAEESKKEASGSLPTENKMKQKIMIQKTDAKAYDVQGADDKSTLIETLDVEKTKPKQKYIPKKQQKPTADNSSTATSEQDIVNESVKSGEGGEDKSALVSDVQGAEDKSTLIETLDVEITEKTKPKRKYAPKKPTADIALTATSEQDTVDESVKSGEGGDGADDSVARTTRTRRGNVKVQQKVENAETSSKERTTKRVASEDQNMASDEKVHSPRKQAKRGTNVTVDQLNPAEDITLTGKRSQRKTKSDEQSVVVAAAVVETISEPDVSEASEAANSSTENDITGSNGSKTSSMVTKKSGRGKKKFEETKLSETSKVEENVDISKTVTGRPKRGAKPEETKETGNETTGSSESGNLSCDVEALGKGSRTRREIKASGILTKFDWHVTKLFVSTLPIACNGFN